MIGVEDWPTWRELRLAALGEAPYAFGSTLADWQGTGDDERRWRARLGDVPANYGADVAGRPAGMISGACDADGPVELISMWVAPFARGRGVGDALIGAVLGWAATNHPGPVVLHVREGNAHAATLYRRHGFVDDGLVDDGGGPLERRMVRP